MLPLCWVIGSLLFSALLPWPTTGSGEAPSIHIEPGNINEVKLTCTSSGWFPEPEVQWTEIQGQILTADSETKTEEENGLFHVETSVTVDKSSGGAISCLIRNPIFSEEKEAHISVADALFSRNYPWIVGLVVLLAFLVVVTTLLARYAVQERKEHKIWKNAVLWRKKELLSRKEEKLKKMKEKLEKEKEKLQKMKEKLEKEKDENSKGLDQRKDTGMKEEIILEETAADPFLQASGNEKSVVSHSERQSLHESHESPV